MKKPWRTSVSIGRERDHARVRVPVLAASVVDLTPAPSPEPDPPRQIHEDAPAGTVTAGAAQRIVGLAFLGAGVLALGTAAVLALDAKGDYDAAVAECESRACLPELYGRVQDAQDQGDLASVVAIVAGAAAIGGAALWWWAPRRAEGRSAAATGARITLGARGVALTGRF